MWSDSIFESLDAAKMHRLVAAIDAAYRGGLAAVRELEPDAALEASIPVPDGGAYTLILDGEKICVITGTTQTLEYIAQASGYANPSMGINSYYWGLSELVYNQLPLDVTLIAGHSMGAAIATCVARRYKAAGRSCRYFGVGSPRLCLRAVRGDPAWAGGIHVHHPYDLVGLVPPASIAGGDWRLPGLTYRFGDNGLEGYDQGQSVVSQYWDIANNHGVSYHDIGSYLNFLRVEGPSFYPERHGPEMNDYYQLTIHGVYHEQRIMNTFWYHYMPNFGGSVPDGALTDGPIALARDFRSMYRTMVLPRLSVDYSVLSYEAKRLDSVQLNGDLDLTVPSSPRWSEVAVENGNAFDVGSIASGVAFPSFVAVGFAKKCGGWRQPIGLTSTAITGTKQPKGSFRIAGIAENNTVSPHNNRIATANVILWENVGNAFIAIPSPLVTGSKKWWMYIARTRVNGASIVNESAAPYTGGIQFAPVNAVELNQYLTSQNSRKQSKHRLG